MRRTFLVWFWASSVGLSQLTGCNLVEKVVKRITGSADPEPAGTDVAPTSSALADAPALSAPTETAPAPGASTVPVVVPAALNSARVKRFDDEKAVEPVEAQIGAANVAVVEDPDAPSAVPLVTLEQRSKVFKVAERGQHVLITFEDPKEKAQFLQGWLPAQALEADAAAAASSSAPSASAPSASAPSASAPSSSAPDDSAAPQPPGTNKVKPKTPPVKSSPPAKSTPPVKTTPPPAEPAPKKKKKKQKGDQL